MTALDDDMAALAAALAARLTAYAAGQLLPEDPGPDLAGTLAALPPPDGRTGRAYRALTELTRRGQAVLDGGADGGHPGPGRWRWYAAPRP
jgi:hypothetical protein